MKKLFAIVLLAFASLASATTLSPIQLLNPSGSTSGQAIVSTGPSSAPAWGTAALASIAANSVLANVTGSAGSPSAFSMPSCSATGNSLQYTSGAGFACATGYALLASPTFTGTPAAPTAAVDTNTTQLATTAYVIGEGYLKSASAASTYAPLASPALTGTPTAPTATAGTSTTQLATTAFVTSSPTINTPTITGVTNGACAAAGNIGECKNATVLSGSAVTLTNATAANVTSVSLTAGNWLCTGTIAFLPNAATSITAEQGWISTTSATLSTPPNAGGLIAEAGPTLTGAQGTNVYPVGVMMQNVTTTTTVFLEAYSAFSTNTQSAYGYINCVRWH